MGLFGRSRFAHSQMRNKEYTPNFSKISFKCVLQVGMRNFHVRKNRTFCPTLNVDKIWSLASDNTREKFANGTDKTAVFDAVKHGYF